MSDIPTSSPPPTEWNVDQQIALCEHCQWYFLTPPNSIQEKCPHCHQQILIHLPDGLPGLPRLYPPERVIPFNLANLDLQVAIDQFSSSIPYPPADLNSRTLLERLSPVFLPMWLVDASVRATWLAEAGFDYQVVSHQERYSQNYAQWQTIEIKEDRVRWEMRAGRLIRAYQNIAVPALEDAVPLQESLGEFQQAKALPYQTSHLSRAYVRLTDFPPAEAWKEASAAFQKAAADECRQACSAGHLRLFRWKAEFGQIHWTLMLLPVYTSYYLDDAGQPQNVLIHGQNGRITGARRSSMRRAGSASLIFLLVGVFLILAGLLLDRFGGSSFLAAISTLIALAGIACTIGSIVPYASAWDFNRKQALRSAEFWEV